MSNESPTEFRTLFSQMVSRPDEDIDLARAALYVSGMEYPDLDVDHYLGILDFLAEGASRYLGTDTVDVEELSRLFDLVAWPRPHNLTQTLRNAARSKFRWLERIPGRSGHYAVTDLGRSTAL